MQKIPADEKKYYCGCQQKKIQFATHNTVVLILYVIQNTNELTKID